MTEPLHSKIVAEYARAVLGSMGFRRRGRSRVWIEDRGWLLFVVDFQASLSRPGATYLNVNAVFAWMTAFHPNRIHWSSGAGAPFQVNDWVFAGEPASARIRLGDEQRIQYRDESQYRADISWLAELAAMTVESYRARYADFDGLLAVGLKDIQGEGPRSFSLHGSPFGTNKWFHAGVVAGLHGEAEPARAYLRQYWRLITSARPDGEAVVVSPWSEFTDKLIDATRDTAAFADCIETMIAEARSEWRLPPWSADYPWRRRPEGKSEPS